MAFHLGVFDRGGQNQGASDRGAINRGAIDRFPGRIASLPLFWVFSFLPSFLFLFLSARLQVAPADESSPLYAY